MIIGLLGCLINNENLGCQALTYSLLALLEDIGKEAGQEFTYFVFEVTPNANATTYVCQRLKIKLDRIKSYDITPLFRKRRFIHHLKTGLETLRQIKKCDVFVDMTGGDSFADIYGQYTFDSETNVKYLVKRLGKKLILGPQTYGPYNKDENKVRAAGIIEKADLVISRDQQSKDYLSAFTNAECHVTTDIAFRLPFERRQIIQSGKKKIGINVSGLLLKNKTESTDLANILKADYDDYICGLIDSLLLEDKYEINIIPHVGEDGNRWVYEKYGNKLIYHGPFDNPISAKSLISEMDIFVGSRMHATIGSFSSGVVTIPVAYSRKFSGLFENIGYPYVIDLQNKTTSECLRDTQEYIMSCDRLKRKMNLSKNIWNKSTIETYCLMKDVLICNKGY